MHLLKRASFGPRPGDLSLMERQGLQSWLQSQLNPRREPLAHDASSSALLESRLGTLSVLGSSNASLVEGYLLAQRRVREQPDRPGQQQAVPAELVQLVRRVQSQVG